MTTVELIYFRECPNVPLARERLLRAFAATGINAHWREWERDDADAPAHARAYGSPTILVDGKDVTGMEPSSDDIGSCRVYAQSSGTFGGAPSIETIAGALRAITAETPKQPAWRGSFAALPAIGAAALPKLTCPACWPAYSGLLSSMGLSFVNYTAYLLPLTALFLLASLFALSWRAPSRRGYRPLLLGIAASLLILVGKFAFDSDAAMFAGMAVLIAASLWNAWPRARQAAGNCPACVSAPTQS